MLRMTAAEVRRLQVSRVPYTAVVLPGGGVILTMLDLPPTLIDWQRWHWAKRAAETQRVTAALVLPVRADHLPAFARAECRYYFATTRRRDTPNCSYWEPFWDALVISGLLPDDDTEHLHVAEPSLLTDPLHPRSEVTLRLW